MAEANFIELITNDSGATIYKSKLLPDKVFFSKGKLQNLSEESATSG